MFEKKITFDGFIRTLGGIAIAIGVLYLIHRLSSVLLPFLIAWLIAYFIYPLVKFFQYRLRLKNRVLSIFCALLLLFAIGVVTFYLLVPPIISEAGKAKDLFVSYLTSGHENGSSVPQILSDFIKESVDYEQLREVFSYENMVSVVKSAVPKVWVILSESINILFGIFTIFIILLYIVFILLDYEALASGWLRLLPGKYRKFAGNLVSDIEVGMNRYFRGQALVALCVGILFSIGFLIIGFPMAIALGLFIGLLNMVPYLQTLGFIPTILLAMLKAADTGQNFWVILLLALVVFVVVQIIQDGFIVPKVMGKITGLNPAVILLSLSVWGSLMGFVGLIIALPLTTLILSYYNRFIIGKEKIASREESDYQEKAASE